MRSDGKRFPDNRKHERPIYQRRSPYWLRSQQPMEGTWDFSIRGMDYILTARNSWRRGNTRCGEVFFHSVSRFSFTIFKLPSTVALRVLFVQLTPTCATGCKQNNVFPWRKNRNYRLSHTIFESRSTRYSNRIYHVHTLRSAGYDTIDSVLIFCPCPI